MPRGTRIAVVHLNLVVPVFLRDRDDVQAFIARMEAEMERAAIDADRIIADVPPSTL